jgi:hypothetical protein
MNEIRKAQHRRYKQELKIRLIREGKIGDFRSKKKEYDRTRYLGNKEYSRQKSLRWKQKHREVHNERNKLAYYTHRQDISLKRKNRYANKMAEEKMVIYKKNYLVKKRLINKRKIENIIKINEYKNKGCNLCGYNKCVSAIDFHHVDLGTKEKGISRLVMTGRPWHIIEKELSKCIVLCSNCHRELHYNQRKIKMEEDKYGTY